MKCSLPLSMLFAVAFSALCAGTSHAEDNDGFKSLFDGKSLKGWHGSADYWSVKEDAIVGTTDGNIPANTFLVSDASYKNFVLKVKWRLHGHKGNSGVQFRSEELKAEEGKTPPFCVGGYQADIADNHFLGILYGERTGRGIIVNLDEAMQKKVAGAINEDGWNEYVITANGDHITQVLNGVTTVDIDDPEGAKDGIIALQLHRGHNMTISFKDIMIKVLD
ncbi:MAG: DUF1080 domain-containing protein [Planctomycetaceae bacterium]|nr:DUF1080 domain-containing protein [Planctomycetaceae bacterium]